MRLAAIVVFVAGLLAVAAAQPVVISGPQGFNADSPYNKLYNTRSVITFKGKVAGKEVAPPMKGMGNAVSLLVKSSQSGKTWHVDVGPEWYVENQVTQVKVGDSIQVTGSRVKVDGSDVILASQIVKGKNVLALRRPIGRPYWDAVSAAAPTIDDQRNLRTYTGQITAIDTFEDGTNGVTQRLRITTEDGEFYVALAPEWYMRRQAVQLSLGNLVNVNAFAPWGVPTTPVGQGLVAPPIIFASSLGFGNNWMVLRSPAGRPLWYGPGG